MKRILQQREERLIVTTVAQIMKGKESVSVSIVMN
jgi:hypothetical protein